MNIVKYFTALLLTLIIWGCTDWVQNVDPYIDQVKDEDLNKQEEVKFLIRGVQQRFALASNNLSVLAGGLSDELFFSYNVRGASYETFNDIDHGDMELDNSSVSNAYDELGEARFFADDLIRRVNSITMTDTVLWYEALYTGYLYGGIARALYADYFGLDENTGGSPVNKSAFIPSRALYDSAIVYFNKALNYAASSYDQQLLNSLIARAYLYQAYYSNDYSQVQTYAQNGLPMDAPDFEALFHKENTHYWYYFCGRGRTQYALDLRFIDYVNNDPDEEARLPLFGRTGWDGQVYWFQDKYPELDSPFRFMSWQENHLMLAEMAVRNSDENTALTLLNEVRASHNIDSVLTTADLSTIAEERDKELMCTGTRLVDQRRFDLWHLPSGAWRYLPVTLDERNANPNIQ